mmetsp:Transcript_8702/g.22824  ORF Transcript_8702/g.22824 Transcript_8702/m.22824 type:complete len:145 (+) Transcript_8702:257-691(+)
MEHEHEADALIPSEPRGRWRESLSAEDREMAVVLRARAAARRRAQRENCGAGGEMEAEGQNGAFEELTVWARVRGALRLAYVRWGVTTAVYMVGPLEAAIINALVLAVALFLLYTVLRSLSALLNPVSVSVPSPTSAPVPHSAL